MSTANRDPDAFPSPDEVVLARPDGHLTFGHGIHCCLAASLARMELEIAIGTAVRRFPDLRLAVPVAELRWRPSSRTRGLIELPVLLQAAPR